MAQNEQDTPTGAPGAPGAPGAADDDAAIAALEQEVAQRRQAPTVLVAEMEHPIPGDAERLRRLRSYERAGFQKVDPAAAPYQQPDF